MGSRQFDEEFAEFWMVYPHKVARFKARVAFDKARKAGATVEEIVTGAQRYVATKPDWQAWAHPATWLNQGRWTDQPAPDTSRMGKQTSRLMAAVANIAREATDDTF